MESKRRNEKGITLITLIITVIVIIILASLSVGMASNNGLFDKAKYASDSYSKKQDDQEKELLAYEVNLEQAITGEDQETALRNVLISKDSNATVTKTNAVYEAKYLGKELLIGNDLRIIEKVEANLDEWTFNEETRTLTAYNGDLTKKRGNQEIGELIVPNYYNGVRVTKIGINLFYYNDNKTDITKLVISDGIDYIGGNAFASCSNITGDLIIPDSVTYIGNTAFSSCISFDGILKLSTNLQYIGQFAFGYLSKVTGDLIIPDSVTYIGSRTFQGMEKLDGVLKLSKNLETLGSEAFYGDKKLTGDITVPEAVSTIGFRAFYNCEKISSITIMNPDIVIENINDTRHDTFYNNIKLRGYVGSTTESYALENGLVFESIE